VSVAEGSYYESVALDRFVRVSLSGDTSVEGDLTISSGALVAASGHLAIAGNLTHSGGVFDPLHKMVIFNGSGVQTITGDTTFFDLAVDSSVILSTTDNVTVTGTLTNLGVTRETKTVDGNESITFGLADVAANVTEPGLATLRVERRDADHPSAPQDIQTGKYWSFTPTGSGYKLDLTLPHITTPDACDQVCRYESTTGRWNCAADTFDPIEGTITRRGIVKLSDWATGEGTGPCGIWLPVVLLSE
jgi:hypothetical protein